MVLSLFSSMTSGQSMSSRGDKRTFFKSEDDKSANFWAHSPIANPQIRKFLRCPSSQIANPQIFMINPQIANPQIFMINPQIANPQISTKYCNTLSHISLFKDFLLCTNLN